MKFKEGDRVQFNDLHQPFIGRITRAVLTENIQFYHVKWDDHEGNNFGPFHESNLNAYIESNDILKGIL